MSNYDEINNMTGESGFKKVEGMKLNKVALNGRDGKFIKTLLLSDKVKDGDKESFQREDLGTELEVVFLKHNRRYLSEFDPKGINGKQTSEHNNKNDYVTLFIGKTREQGIAAELREKYDKLKTVQVVYAYIPSLKETVRLEIKGASLQSKSTAKGVLKYYDYLSSFGKEEHSWQYITKMTLVKEAGPAGNYYATSFIKGTKLTDEQIAKMASLIKEIHSVTQAQDEYSLSKIPKDILKSAEQIEKERQIQFRKDVIEHNAKVDSGAIKVKEDVIEYPEEEINPEDIPF
jgi:hypothetical protein